jgi:hypothetical protein
MGRILCGPCCLAHPDPCGQGPDPCSWFSSCWPAALASRPDRPTRAVHRPRATCPLESWVMEAIKWRFSQGNKSFDFEWGTVESIDSTHNESRLEPHLVHARLSPIKWTSSATPLLFQNLKPCARIQLLPPHHLAAPWPRPLGRWGSGPTTVRRRTEAGWAPQQQPPPPGPCWCSSWTPPHRQPQIKKLSWWQTVAIGFKARIGKPSTILVLRLNQETHR